MTSFEEVEKKECERLLHQWGAWCSDAWLKHELGFNEQAWKRQVKTSYPDAPKIRWINPDEAERMNECVLHLGLVDFELFRIVVDFYPHRNNADSLADKYDISRRTVYRRLDAAKEILWGQWRHKHAA